jgi:hypothetical protein
MNTFDVEHDMKRALVIGLALAGALAIPASAQDTGAPANSVHHRVHHVVHDVYRTRESIAPSATAQLAPLHPAFGLPWLPAVAPYPNGAGDEDGLSRNVDDCNKGCIDGNPN